MFQYDEKFYKHIEKTKMDEAIIIPQILQWVSPKSIIDFGCGEGAWLSEALRQDDKIEILGIDGDYVNRKRLKIPEKNFWARDLRKEIRLNRKFDLAISTEVAEHLEDKFADIFINNITKASDKVLFSAAVPGQGGTNHVNEQWQSYWIDKFEERGYFCDYSIRDFFWSESRISSWRKQNILFFSKTKSKIAPHREIKDVIHPDDRERIQRAFDEKIEHYIAHPDIYIKLDRALAEIVTKRKKIVIYPYGLNGILCEKILHIKYGIKDYIIADNIVKIKNKKIYKAEELKKLLDEIIVIDTCENALFHKEILDIIQKYVDKDRIYSVF